MPQINFTAKLVRTPVNAKSKNWQDTANQWLLTLNGQTFDYYTGIGIKKSPVADDLIYSLVSDASACDMPFEDWCSDFGMDTDSRKALEMYLACQEAGAKLRKAGINIAEERERLQDY